MSFRSPALFVGIAVSALLGGAGVAYAAIHAPNPIAARTTSTSVTPSSSAPAVPAPVPGRRAGLRFGLGLSGLGGLGLGPGLGGAVHGQLTMPKSGGGYQTVDVQSGTVSAVSSTSITVKSADEFTATYAVSGATEVNAESAGIGSIKSGDTVYVEATTSGGTTTAADITDITSIKNSRGSFGFRIPAQRSTAGPATSGNA